VRECAGQVFHLGRVMFGNFQAQRFCHFGSLN
jgi:hypothetical protein